MKQIFKALLFSYVLGLSSCTIGSVNYKPNFYGSKSLDKSSNRDFNSEKRGEEILEYDFDDKTESIVKDDDFTNKYSGVIKRKNRALDRMKYKLDHFDDKEDSVSGNNLYYFEDRNCNLPSSLDSLILNDGENVFLPNLKCGLGRVIVYDPNYKLYDAFLSDNKTFDYIVDDYFNGHVLKYDSNANFSKKFGVSLLYFIDDLSLVDSDDDLKNFVDNFDVFYDNSNNFDVKQKWLNYSDSLYYVNYFDVCNKNSDIFDFYSVLSGLKKSNFSDVFDYHLNRLCKFK